MQSSEDRDPSLLTWCRKHIVWSDNEKPKRTAISIVYVHGFSASSGEIRPVPDLIAKALNSNVYYARLSGHGSLDPLALGKCSPSDWIADVQESLYIGQRIGEKVIVIATSFGAALVSECLSRNNMGNKLIGTIYISPCFGIKDWRAYLFQYSWWSKIIFPLIFGRIRVVRSQTRGEFKWWTQIYPVKALSNLVLSVEKIWRSNFLNIKAPNLTIYSVKDRWISIPRIIQFPTRWGGGATLKHLEVPLRTDNSGYHVILGDIKSPALNNLGVKIILDWLQLNRVLIQNNGHNKTHNANHG